MILQIHITTYVEMIFLRCFFQEKKLFVFIKPPDTIIKHGIAPHAIVINILPITVSFDNNV